MKFEYLPKIGNFELNLENEKYLCISRKLF